MVPLAAPIISICDAQQPHPPFQIDKWYRSAVAARPFVLWCCPGTLVRHANFAKEAFGFGEDGAAVCAMNSLLELVDRRKVDEFQH